MGAVETDWVEDDSLSADETLARFEALGPMPVIRSGRSAVWPTGATYAPETTSDVPTLVNFG
jgi:hypothetical protein